MVATESIVQKKVKVTSPYLKIPLHENEMYVAIWDAQEQNDA